LLAQLVQPGQGVEADLQCADDLAGGVTLAAQRHDAAVAGALAADVEADLAAPFTQRRGEQRALRGLRIAIGIGALHAQHVVALGAPEQLQLRALLGLHGLPRRQQVVAQPQP